MRGIEKLCTDKPIYAYPSNIIECLKGSEFNNPRAQKVLECIHILRPKLTIHTVTTMEKVRTNHGSFGPPNKTVLLTDSEPDHAIEAINRENGLERPGLMRGLKQGFLSKGF